MKKLLGVIIAVASLVSFSSSFAQEVFEDVIYLKDGGVRRGLILELIPNESVKIKTAYGEVFVINMSDISKIAKEESNVPGHKPIANTNKSLSGASDVKLESWYTYWGLGISNNAYPEPLDEMLDILNKIPGVTRMSINLDVLGFYKPVNSKTILGFIVNGSGDRIEVTDKVLAADSGVNSMQINLTTYAASAQYFPAKIGKGLFWRGDIGIATGGTVTNDNESESSDPGLGLLVGIGYAHPITTGTRVALNLNFASRTIEGDTYRTIGLSLGGLF